MLFSCSHSSTPCSTKQNLAKKVDLCKIFCISLKHNILNKRNHYNCLKEQIFCYNKKFLIFSHILIFDFIFDYVYLKKKFLIISYAYDIYFLNFNFLFNTRKYQWLFLYNDFFFFCISLYVFLYKFLFSFSKRFLYCSYLYSHFLFFYSSERLWYFPLYLF